jgi:hypothetical protein
MACGVLVASKNTEAALKELPPPSLPPPSPPSPSSPLPSSPSPSPSLPLRNSRATAGGIALLLAKLSRVHFRTPVASYKPSSSLLLALLFVVLPAANAQACFAIYAHAPPIAAPATVF